MLTASFYFLGVATSIFAARFLTTGKRAEKSVEVDLDTLHAASICLSTGRRVTLGDLSSSICKDVPWEEKARLSDWKSLWMQWYKRCKRKAYLKTESDVFVGSHDGVMCCTLFDGSPS